jgi:hypothetical protein
MQKLQVTITSTYIFDLTDPDTSDDFADCLNEDGTFDLSAIEDFIADDLSVSMNLDSEVDALESTNVTVKWLEPEAAA